MLSRWRGCSAILLGAACAAAAAQGPAATAPARPDERTATRPSTAPAAGERPRVALEITIDDQPAGTIVLELRPDRAPITVQNFLRYVDEGFYDGTIFHRIRQDFLIQGGGYTELGGPEKKGHDPIRNEAGNGLRNVRGAVAAARWRDPNSATSQFFINVVDNPWLDREQGGIGYAVFGRVVEGMDVVDKIRFVPTEINPERPTDGASRPLQIVRIVRARRVDSDPGTAGRP